MFFRGPLTKRLLLGGLLLIAPLGAWAQQEAPTVTVSIKPLQHLAAAITAGRSEPTLLMRGSADPHSYSLRPSDRQALEESDIVLWVGPAMERPLARVVKQLDSRVISALELPEMRLLEDGERVDPHVWMDVENALRIASHLTQALSELDPDNAAHYKANLDALGKTLSELDISVMPELIEIGDPQPFAVYHNAYAYLEQRYDYPHEFAFTDHEELNPGLRRLVDIRDRVTENEIGCVLVGPQVNLKQLQRVFEKAELYFIELDVLARDREVDKQSFGEFMRHATAALIECVKPQP